VLQFRQSVAQILRFKLQRLSHSSETVVTRLLQFTALPASKLVGRFIRILRNVKTVLDNESILCVGIYTCLIRLPYVHTDGPGLSSLRKGQCFPQDMGRFCRSVRSQLPHAGFINVRHHGDVILSFAETLFVDPNVNDLAH